MKSLYPVGYQWAKLEVLYRYDGRVLLRCDCSREIWVSADHLKSTPMRDCGCSKTAQIYFIRVHDCVKIGYTTGPIDVRMTQVRINCPYPISLMRVISGTVLDERWLHEHFDHLRVHGEWFVYDPKMMTVEPNTEPEIKIIMSASELGLYKVPH